VRVLFDARTLSPHYPGVGRYGRGLLSALAGQPNVHITALVEHGTPAPLGLPPLPAARVRSLADQLLTPVRLRRALAGSDGVYHAPFYLYPYLLTLPTVVTVYDAIPLAQPAGYSPAARLLYTLAHRMAAWRARRIITLTAAARDDCVRRLGLPASKFVVVPPGHTPPPPKASAPSEPFMLYVGINKPHKNLPALVRAYAGLGPDAPPLLVAGPRDPRFPEAQQTAEHAGVENRVRFLGHVPEADLARLYGQARLLVLPSLAEGFGFPVLEAMACGTPVLCSDLPVLREVAGEAALYFDPLQPEAIAAALSRALASRELRAELGTRGLARAAEFTWARAAASTLAVYASVLGRTAPDPQRTP
jgi:glycosyltransferase involved in cell wall biosynthesis